jgi:tripeptide aminopeptidase
VLLALKRLQKEYLIDLADAATVVRDRVLSRSENAGFAAAITGAYEEAFVSTAAQVKDDRGATTEVTFEGRVDYYPFRLAEDAPAVRHARRAAEWIALKSSTKFSHGSLDANWFAKHGLPTVTIGAGQAEIHTVKEFVELPELANGCRLAVALATLES